MPHHGPVLQTSAPQAPGAFANKPGKRLNGNERCRKNRTYPDKRSRKEAISLAGGTDAGISGTSRPHCHREYNPVQIPESLHIATRKQSLETARRIAERLLIVGDRATFPSFRRHSLGPEPVLTLTIGNFRGDSFLFFSVEAGKGLAQPFHGKLPVLTLRTPLAGLNDDTGGKMADANGRVGNIPMLTTGAACAIELHSNVSFFYFHHKTH